MKKGEFLKHPLFTSIVSTLLGAGLLSWLLASWTQNKIKAETAIQQKIIFLDEVANKINGALSYVYGVVHTESIDSLDWENISSSIGLLDDNLMNVKVKSVAYLSDENFNKNYRAIQEELDEMGNYLESIKDNKFDKDSDLKKIRERISQIENDWQLSADTAKIEQDSPYKEIYIWTELIEHKSENVISEELHKSLNE